MRLATKTACAVLLGVGALILLLGVAAERLVQRSFGEIETDAARSHAALTKQNFPENQVAVMPEGLNLHTQEGFAELLSLGVELATAVADMKGNEVWVRDKASDFLAKTTPDE